MWNSFFLRITAASIEPIGVSMRAFKFPKRVEYSEEYPRF